MNGWMHPPSPEEKKILGNLSPDQVTADTLAGEPILKKLTRAPGNDAPIGGLKVETENGWFAARPSGTEDIYKIYTESFKGIDHLKQIQEEAVAIVNAVFVVVTAAEPMITSQRFQRLRCSRTSAVSETLDNEMLPDGDVRTT
jgi:hypothetical protein